MRNPNRFGTCYRLSGKRRNPFIARAYLGKKDGKPIYKTIGYFKTKSEGQQALLNYKFNPYNIDIKNVTLEELFQSFKEQNESDLNSFYENYERPFKKLEPLYHFMVRDLKPLLFQNILNELGAVHKKSYCRTIKFVTNRLLDYAVANDVIPYNYAHVLKVKGKEKEEQTYFTIEEVKKLVNSSGKVKNVEMVIFMCLTGVRPSEMLNIRISNIDIENNIMHNFGVKTKASKEKRIPIPSLLKPFILQQIKVNDEWLFEYIGRQISYERYLRMHKRILADVGIEYKSPKAARHFFATFTNNENINDFTRKKILGHTNINFTNDVYTHAEDRKINEEYKEIEKALERHLTKN